MFFLGRPHYDTRVNASNVSSFNQPLQSLFTQLCLENPFSHIVVLAEPKLQLVSSQSCKFKIAGAIGIWKCLMECQDWSLAMFLITNCNIVFCERLVLDRSSLCKVETLQSTFSWKSSQHINFSDDRNGIWLRWRLQYWTLLGPLALTLA